MDARKKSHRFRLRGPGLSVALAVLVSPGASSSPDGLEKVAEDKGFLEKAEETEPVWNNAPIPDYAVPGLTETVEVEDEETGLTEEREEPTRLATALAGLIGTVAVFLIGWGLALLLTLGKEKEEGGAPPAADAA